MSTVWVSDQAKVEVGAAEPTDPALPVAHLTDKDLQVMEDRDRIRLLRARMQLYRVKHDGELPPDLDALRAEHVDADTFVSAGSDRPFVYLGPAGKGGVLIHGHPNGSDGKIHVLVTDGFVIDRITPAELAKRLGR